MITKAKKRLLTFTMVLMVYVVAVLSPVSVSQTRVMAAECEGDYEYIYLPDNSVEITSYNGTDAQVVLPDNISEEQSFFDKCRFGAGIYYRHSYNENYRL